MNPYSSIQQPVRETERERTLRPTDTPNSKLSHPVSPAPLLKFSNRLNFIASIPSINETKRFL